MFCALRRCGPLLLAQLTLLNVGCAGTDGALLSRADAESSNVERDAAISLTPSNASSAIVDSTDAGPSDAGPENTRTQTPEVLDASHADVAIDSGTDSAVFDASSPDSGAFDSELCARACRQSTHLPCRDDTCHARCVEELTANCHRFLRALYACLASSDPSEFTCDQDGFLVGPTSCNPERAAYIECKL